MAPRICPPTAKLTALRLFHDLHRYWDPSSLPSTDSFTAWSKSILIQLPYLKLERRNKKDGSGAVQEARRIDVVS